MNAQFAAVEALVSATAEAARVDQTVESMSLTAQRMKNYLVTGEMENFSTAYTQVMYFCRGLGFTTAGAGPAPVATTVLATTSPASAPVTSPLPGNAIFDLFVQAVQNRIRTTPTPGAFPVPDAVVTCPKPHPILKPGDWVGCQVRSATIGDAIAAVQILAAGGTQFSYAIGGRFICSDLPHAEAQALLDDVNITNLDTNHDGIACNG